MQVEVTFEELDWNCNVVKKVRKFKHHWNPKPEMLLKASVEDNPACIGFPTSNVSSMYFLLIDLAINTKHTRSALKAVAHFKGWDLIVFERGSEVMRWEAT